MRALCPLLTESSHDADSFSPRLPAELSSSEVGGGVARAHVPRSPRGHLERDGLQAERSGHASSVRCRQASGLQKHPSNSKQWRQMRRSPLRNRAVSELGTHGGSAPADTDADWKGVPPLAAPQTRAWHGALRAQRAFPAALPNASTISSTDVPFPVPRLYTTQPADRDARPQLTDSRPPLNPITRVCTAIVLMGNATCDRTAFPSPLSAPSVGVPNTFLRAATWPSARSTTWM